MLCSVFLFLFVLGVDSARILCIFPMPAVSHQAVFNAYVQGLLKHGHEIVLITPNPTLPKDRPPDNLTEIEVGLAYEVRDANVMDPLSLIAKRGVVIDLDTLFEAQSFSEIILMIAEFFKTPEVKNLIEDKNQHFDLIVAEAFMNYHLIASKIFNAPVILLSSFCGLPESFDIMGSVSVHPILHPNVQRSYIGDITLLGKIKDVYRELKIKYMFRLYDEYENELLKQNFGTDAPTVEELKNNVAMLFVNCHTLFGDNRPVPPSVIHLGALHLKPVNELPQDLKTYLDSSKRGVVYVSLGTNVNPSNMHKDLLEAFLNAFEALPYDILWKFDGDHLDKMPKNLKIQKWFPQRDLLMHPNIKAFVTQGGLQSTDEAIDAGVPLVGIPMLGDQWFNTGRYVKLGIGVKLDALTLTAADLAKAVKTVIEDDSYRDNLKKVQAIIHDEPLRPMERAVWWTEHVLRNKGGKHLRAPAANMSWSEYLMIDVLMSIVFAVFAMSLLSLLVICYIVKLILKMRGKKSVNLKFKKNI